MYWFVCTVSLFSSDHPCCFVIIIDSNVDFIIVTYFDFFFQELRKVSFFLVSVCTCRHMWACVYVCLRTHDNQQVFNWCLPFTHSFILQILPFLYLPDHSSFLSFSSCTHHSIAACFLPSICPFLSFILPSLNLPFLPPFYLPTPYFPLAFFLSLPSHFLLFLVCSNLLFSLTCSLFCTRVLSLSLTVLPVFLPQHLPRCHSSVCVFPPRLRVNRVISNSMVRARFDGDWCKETGTGRRKEGQ